VQAWDEKFFAQVTECSTHGRQVTISIVFFITSNVLTAEDQTCGKVLVANGKNEQLDFCACKTCVQAL